MELYVHIPFCVRKCAYCDFLSFAAEDELKERYTDALIKELGSLSGLLMTAPVFDTVFIGGGTPSLLEPEIAEKLLSVVSPMVKKDGEFTIECNPGTLNPDKLRMYRKYGINRLSIGLQSADDGELAELGRIHRYGDFLESYEAARSAGFNNINIDLMSGLPGQTVACFEKTLRTVAKLGCVHMSVYGLIIEPGTVFFDMYHEGRKKDINGAERHFVPLPSEEEEREMYHITQRVLADYGFSRYEISNYAKPGYECRHNLGYWTGEEYIGAGIGAASYFKNERYRNTADIGKYIEYASNGDWDSLYALREEREHIGNDEKVEEYIILRLRLTEGFSKEEFKKKFGFPVTERYSKIIEKHINNGLLTDAGDRLFLSERGLDLSNSVMSDFLD